MKVLCWWLLGACLLGSCLEIQPSEIDTVPPTVIEFRPHGDDLAVDTEFTILFSEPVVFLPAPNALVVLLPAAEADGTFLADLDKPPLAAKQANRLHPCRIIVELEGMRVIVRPEAALEPGTEYRLLVSAAVTDLAGNGLVDKLRYDDSGRLTGIATHVGHDFTTRPGGVIISEILANPAGDESAGEYIEIVNLGTAPVDLSAWSLDDQGGQSPGDLLGPCTDGQDTHLVPGAIALLAGRDFLPPADLPESTLILCTDRTTLTPRGLRNTGDEILVLADPTGTQIDRYGGWIDQSTHEGCSAIRIDPWQPDTAANWTRSTADPCQSPGW